MLNIPMYIFKYILASRFKTKPFNDYIGIIK